MNWHRSASLSASLDAWLRTHGPLESTFPYEPTHSYEERWEPDQTVIGEVCGSGKGASKSSRPSLIVCNSSSAIVQCFNHNENLKFRQAPDLPLSDFQVLVRESSPSSLTKPKLRYSKSPQVTRIPGTRLRIRFNNVGRGVGLLVPISVPLVGAESSKASPGTVPQQYQGSVTGALKLVPTDATTGLFAPESKSVAATSDGRLAAIPILNKTGYATYEVEQSDPKVLQEANIDVYVTFHTNTASNLPELGTTTISVGFAPASTATAVEPQLRNAFRIQPPACHLLFPFVTSRSGFDTRIVIANTSLDPFGTMPQSGPMRLYFFDRPMAPGSCPPGIETGPIQAGQTFAFSVSTGCGGVPPMPEFEGYVIAVTNFMYCHALAFISPTQGQGSGHSYQAIHVLNRGGQNPEPPW